MGTAVEPGRSSVPVVKKRGARVPLVLKIFIVTASVVAVVVLSAIVVTVQRSEKVAQATARESITSAAKLFRTLERDRLARLALGAESLANESTFVAFIQDAVDQSRGTGELTSPGAGAPGQTSGNPAAISPSVDPSAPPLAAGVPDLLSIHDQLVGRREILRSDLLAVTDDEGILLARSDRPPLGNAEREDLYDALPQLKSMIDNGAGVATSGLIVLGQELYHASIAPMQIGAGSVVQGYVINAYRIDEAFANSIADATRSSVAFLPRGSGESPRSLDAPNAAAIRKMKGVQQAIDSGKPIAARSVDIERGRYVVTGEPLTGGGIAVGSAIFARDLDRVLAPFREIERTLMIAGFVALLLSFPLSWFIAKRLTRPIEMLAAAAEQIADGDYSVQSDMDRNDEVGVLSRSFNQMVSALRDKAELEKMYAELTLHAPKPAEALAAPRREEGTILVTDLRGIPPDLGDGDPASVVALVSRAMRLQESEVRRQEGEVREIVGHHLVSVFSGERSVTHAIRAVRAMREELALQMSGDAQLSLGAGIATGVIISGGVELSNTRGLAMVGNAPLLALLFAWEAPTGTVFLSSESAQAAGSEILAGATREEVQLRWLAAPLAAFSLPLQSLTTGVMRAIGTVSPSSMATMRVGSNEAFLRDLEPGVTFAGRYKIEQLLGRGGMGVVYRALDMQLDETVAIKTLPGDAMQRSAEELERFKREIRIARKITHRNVLRTYDYGEADGTYFISMEYVRGYTLADLLAKPQSSRVSLSVVRQVSRGLEAAHEAGIVHRDIKPQNILIDQRGEVKLMDFGISRMSEGPDSMTAAGLIIGTPHYMSPEQVRGESLDSGSDVYAMGILMYEVFCGRRPFESDALTAVLGAHLTEVPRPPIELRSEIGTELNAIILRCLEKDRKNRYAHAGELLEALDRLEMKSAA